MMTSWLGVTASCTSALGIVLSPLVGGLSDAIGRRSVVAVGRMGAALYMITSLLARSMRQQFFLVVFAQGIVMQGNLAVQQAMFDDLFAERPQLGALIMANNDIPRNLAGTVGPMIGALCVSYCEPVGHWLPFALITGSSVLWATGAETLPPEKRKPFRFGRSNPFSSVLVLLRNGRGLRQLALAAGIYNSCITPTVGFRQGLRTLATPHGLNWSPAQSNLLDSANFLWNSFSNKFVQPPLLRKYNNKGAFEIWSVVAIVCAVGVSLSWRPAGTASQLRRSIQYAIPALIVTHPWGEVCMNSIRAMTIKQGIAVRAILC
jgi:DHA1 family tetracycline resistance protein-like MFS transporter